MISMTVVGNDGRTRLSEAGKSALGGLKSGYFNRKAVIAAIDAAERVALTRAGAYVRKVARNSMKKRKVPSAPGTPPSSREGDPERGPRAGFLRKSIEFAYEPRDRSVIIGPIGLFDSAVPRTHEFGGTLSFRNPRRIKRQVGKGGPLRIVSAGARGATVKPVTNDRLERHVVYAKLYTMAQVARAEKIETGLYGPMFVGNAKYPKRPYMGPALRASAPHIAKFFQNAVRL